MEGVTVVGLITVFIVAAVVVGVGVQVLSQASEGFDCSTLQGYVPIDLGSDGKVGMTQGSSTSGDTPAKFPAGTWAGACKSTEEQIQGAWSLMVVVLVILSAAAILLVVRSFSQ